MVGKSLLYCIFTGQLQEMMGQIYAQIVLLGVTIYTVYCQFPILYQCIFSICYIVSFTFTVSWYFVHVMWWAFTHTHTHTQTHYMQLMSVYWSLHQKINNEVTYIYDIPECCMHIYTCAVLSGGYR